MHKYMTEHKNSLMAEILIQATVKSVGKREFLKTVEKLYGEKKDKTQRSKTDVPADVKCIARVKGDRTGMKVGRYVIFDVARCDRKEIDGHLCAIHSNQVAKFGELPYGAYNDPITEDLKKVFGEI